MIEPASNQSVTTHAAAAGTRTRADDGFKASLAARTTAQVQGPIAQYLLGIGADNDADRQKQARRGTRAAASISDLSSMAVADLSAPRLSSKIEPSSGGGGDEARHRQSRGHRGESGGGIEHQRSAHQSQITGRGPAGMGSEPSKAAPSDPLQSQMRPDGREPVAEGRASAAPVSAPAARAASPQTGAAGGTIQSRRDQNSGNASQRQDSGAAARALNAAQRISGRQGGPAPGAQAAHQRTFAAQLEHETKFAAQLSRGLAAALRNGGAVTVRLQPEALGDLKITMDLKPGRVAASFEVQTDQARQLLNQNMTLLRSALEARGMDVERLEVRVAEPAERGGPGQTRDAATQSEHDTGGAGAEDADEGRWEAPSRYADGGAAGKDQSPERDEQEPAQEAPASTSAALRLWLQQVEMGGAQVMRMRLDAVA